MNVGQLCSRPPVVCDQDEPIRQVARLMLEHDVGAVVIVDADDRPVGIVTDRDLSLRSLARGLDPTGSVASVMTTSAVTVGEHVDALDAARHMGTRHCRRLPVVDDDGRVVGVISADDLTGRSPRTTWGDDEPVAGAGAG